MCLLPYPNYSFTSKAFKMGITEYKCGYCPECLAERAKRWTLRCLAEAENNFGMMITLTYDQYIRDKKGNIIGETVADRNVDKTDCQKFIKRLRYYYPNNNIKYMITAEYGKTTGRPHYHAIIFGLQFDDIVYYKKSKRGNIIYTSRALTKIWGNGICTVDSINITGKIARYCTKYCAKDGRTKDTFMLFSRDIGKNSLLKKFNFLRYCYDGRKYSIPRNILVSQLENRYNLLGYSKYVGLKFSNDENITKTRIRLKNRVETLTSKMLDLYSYSLKKASEKIHFYQSELLKYTLLSLSDTKKRKSYLRSFYVRQVRLARAYAHYNSILVKRSKRLEYFYSLYNSAVHESFVFDKKNSDEALFKRYKRANLKRSIFNSYKHSNSLYHRYIDYWQKSYKTSFISKQSNFQRILSLPNSKYFRFKQNALSALNKQRIYKVLNKFSKHAHLFHVGANIDKVDYFNFDVCRLPPCHKTANDRKKKLKKVFLSESEPLTLRELFIFADSYQQISLF